MYKYRLPNHHIRPSIGLFDTVKIDNLYNSQLNYHHIALYICLHHTHHILYSRLRNVHRNLF